jgi:predicted hotdog family 3-hydroxylacyl-ACP dehydratase
MDASWLELRDAAEVRPGRIEARGLIPADSPFFSGHFPGNPVVPGIALLGLVQRSLAAVLPEREVSGFRRVKFRRVLQQGGVLEASVEVGKFEVTFQGDLLCDGLVAVLSVAAAPARAEPLAREERASVPSVEKTRWTPEELIPHRDRMKLIDTIVEVNDDHCVTRATVTKAWPLCADGVVDAVVLVELVAQTASAAASWDKRHSEAMGGAGYLVGIKRASWSRACVPVGTLLTTTVTNEVRRENYGVFVGRVEGDEGLTAEVAVQAVKP